MAPADPGADNPAVRTRRLHLWLVCLPLSISLSFLVGIPTDASAAVGDLTPLDCVDDNDTGAEACAQSTNGLLDAGAVAVSPDGTSVYAVGLNDASVVWLARDPSTGALTPMGCIDDNDFPNDTCGLSTDGMSGPRDVVVSPDGTSVYVVTSLDNALVRFARDPATGALTPLGCIDDNDTGGDACSQSTDGLHSPNAVTVSPDSRSVYVAGMGDDAVVRFGRDPATGTLSPTGCLADNDTGTEPCALMIDGLDGVISVTVSADGRNVYASSFIDNAVVVLSRIPDGSLTPIGCVEDNDTGPDGCAQSADGLDAAQQVAVSRDGLALFVVAQGDEDLAWFDRDPNTGALTPRGCIEDDDGGADTCAQMSPGLFVAVGVTVSPDGRTVYTAGLGDDAVAVFDRDLVTGAVTPRGCVDDDDSGLDACAQVSNGLDTVNTLAVSPDGRSLYASASGDDAVVRFAREPDSDPPETKLKGRKRTAKRRPKFKLSSDEPLVTFECKVDKKKWKQCGSPFRTRKLKEGRHRIKARATDTAGNTDPTPAKKRFRILER